MVEETNNTCSNGGPTLVPINSSVEVSINSSAYACVAGSSVVIYDIIVFENATVIVISGNTPLLSLNVTVLPGPAATFYLANYKSNASQSFSKLVNVTMVTFQDAGQNVHSRFP